MLFVFDGEILDDIDFKRGNGLEMMLFFFDSVILCVWYGGMKRNLRV